MLSTCHSTGISSNEIFNLKLNSLILLMLNELTNSKLITTYQFDKYYV